MSRVGGSLGFSLGLRLTWIMSLPSDSSPGLAPSNMTKVHDANLFVPSTQHHLSCPRTL